MKIKFIIVWHTDKIVHLPTNFPYEQHINHTFIPLRVIAVSIFHMPSSFVPLRRQLTQIPQYSSVNGSCAVH